MFFFFCLHTPRTRHSCLYLSCDDRRLEVQPQGAFEQLPMAKGMAFPRILTYFPHTRGISAKRESMLYIHPEPCPGAPVISLLNVLFRSRFPPTIIWRKAQVISTAPRFTGGWGGAFWSFHSRSPEAHS
jgi:hypothetical protein